MPAHPRVTVLMAVYHPQPGYFLQAVSSILAQTFRDFELLVVEDPSPREAAEFLTSCNDSRIRHIRNPHRTSLVDQKNLGLRAARAELVAMFDADDVAEPNRLAEQVAFLQDHQDVCVLGSQIRIIDSEGRPRGYRSFPLEHEGVVGAMRREVPLSHPSIMLRKTPVLEAGGYQFRDYPAAEDYELWSRLARRGARFANHPEPLLRYRVHAGQMKCTHLRQTIRAILRVKRMYWADEMGLRSRLRVLVERSMLALPPWLVLRLFAATQYQKCLRRRPSLTTPGGLGGGARPGELTEANAVLF